MSVAKVGTLESASAGDLIVVGSVGKCTLRRSWIGFVVGCSSVWGGLGGMSHTDDNRHVNTRLDQVIRQGIETKEAKVFKNVAVEVL